MKVTSSVILLGVIAVALALPAPREEEVEFVPLEAREDPIIIDTSILGSPWSSPFDGVLESLAGMMARMRQQMDYLLRRFPLGNSTAPEVPFPGFPDIDLTKANTTSVTKVIDGHKVVINETEYNSRDGDAFFKVRIIDVNPDTSAQTTESNAESITESKAESITVPPKEPESVESSLENEIPKNKEIEDFSSIETFEQPISTRKMPIKEPLQKFPQWSALESFEDNSIDTVDSSYRPHDLSRDTYVNQLMADAGAPTNPDAEVFSPSEYSGPVETFSPGEYSGPFTDGRRRRFERITLNPV